MQDKDNCEEFQQQDKKNFSFKSFFGKNNNEQSENNQNTMDSNLNKFNKDNIQQKWQELKENPGLQEKKESLKEKFEIKKQNIDEQYGDKIETMKEKYSEKKQNIQEKYGDQLQNAQENYHIKKDKVIENYDNIKTQSKEQYENKKQELKDQYNRYINYFGLGLYATCSLSMLYGGYRIFRVYSKGQKFVQFMKKSNNDKLDF